MFLTLLCLLLLQKHLQLTPLIELEQPLSNLLRSSAPLDPPLTELFYRSLCPFSYWCFLLFSCSKYQEKQPHQNCSLFWISHLSLSSLTYPIQLAPIWSQCYLPWTCIHHEEQLHRRLFLEALKFRRKPLWMRVHWKKKTAIAIEDCNETFLRKIDIFYDIGIVNEGHMYRVLMAHWNTRPHLESAVSAAAEFLGYDKRCSIFSNEVLACDNSVELQQWSIGTALFSFETGRIY